MSFDADAHPDHRRSVLSALPEVTIGRFDVDDLLLELLARISELLQADTAAVLLLDQSGRYLTARAARGIEQEVRQGVRVPVGAGFAGRVAAERRGIILDRVDATTVQNPLLWEAGIKHMLGVPLSNGARVLGVLHVGTTTDRGFTNDDLELLELVADRVTAAIEVRELEVERAAARVLQRSLLPSGLPSLPEVEFASRYVPAEEGGVGGDWYDAFLLPSGELWVMVGDVEGHGLNAAVIMGRLRATLRAYALLSNEPSEVLARADKKLQLFEPGRIATVLCGIMSPPYDKIRLGSAGHLPPVLAEPSGTSRFIEIPTAPPLGVGSDRLGQAVDVVLPPGSVLLSYTDGLIERREESLERGFERLLEATRPMDPELLCRSVMEALVGRIVPRDDIAVLALWRLPGDAA